MIPALPPDSKSVIPSLPPDSKFPYLDIFPFMVALSDPL
jgi:hypothetical protein